MIPSNLIWIMPAKGKVIDAARSSIPEVYTFNSNGMEILLNNQPKEIGAPQSVQQLLCDLVGEKQKGIAVAINNAVIPRAHWPRHLIQANDQVLIIKATQGG